MAIKYIPYFPDTIEGQAILNNFIRTRKHLLKYRDSSNYLDEKLKRGMPLYDVIETEPRGYNKDNNLIIRGECIPACAYLKEKGIKIDLVYIDPPFASGADYAKKIYIRRNPKVAETIAKAERELKDEELRTFEEKMYGDVWDKEKYLNWMYENLMAIKSVMSESASIYVHLDWHISHYVKILMDEIFGEDNFINEIIWWYPSGSDPSKNFNRKHDNIFWYAKNKDIDYTFNFDDVAIPYTKEQEKRFKEWDEEKQNWFYWNKNPRGETVKTYKKSGIGEYDVWNIGIDATHNKTIGYATSKPPKLLERIIKASSNEGMVVADFFGGSGVTSAMAYQLNRKFIHCDIGINSKQVARDWLYSLGASFDVLEIEDGVSLFRNPVQTMDKLRKVINGLKNEDALDKFWEGAIQDSKFGSIPVYIPNLMDDSTKILDLVLINRIIHEAIPDLPENTKKVIVYYVDIIDKKEIDDFINEYNDTGIDIELRDLKEILDDIIVEDYVEFKVSKKDEELFKGWKVEITNFQSDRVQSKIDAYNQKAKINSSSQEDEDISNQENEPVTSKKKFNPIIISDSGLELIEYISLDCTNQEKEDVWNSDSEIKIDKLGYISLNGKKTKDFWDGSIYCERRPLRLLIRNICGDESKIIIKTL